MSKCNNRVAFGKNIFYNSFISKVLDNLNKIRGRKAPAFTLTEVLLAVLIVGIIAALVLPAVVTKYQDKTFESAYNREVHSLQDSIDSLAAVENQQSFYETTLAKTPETYMKKYLRVSKYCGASGKDCFGKFYSEYSDHEKKTYTPSYDGNCAILKNGTSVCLNVNGGNIAMLIDVNGPKGPNVWGRDLRTYTHSVKGITGYDMSSNGIISLNQTPIEDNSNPDPDPDPTPDPTPTPTPTPEPKCTASNTSLACCKERGITKGQSDPCCKYSYFDNNSTCHPTKMLMVEFNSSYIGPFSNTSQITVNCSSNSGSIDLSLVSGNVTALWLFPSYNNPMPEVKTYPFWGCGSNKKVISTQDSVSKVATGFQSANIKYNGKSIPSSSTCSTTTPRCVMYYEWKD